MYSFLFFRSTKDNMEASSAITNSWFNSVIEASDLGSTKGSDQSCIAKYSSCGIPLKVIRPSLTTLLYGWTSFNSK